MSFRFRRRRTGLDESRFEAPGMTPMIDVVFQLLIFFMLSMHFKEVEGKLLSQLPKNKGPESVPTDRPDFEELRIVLCAGSDWRTHLQDKGKHEKVDKDGSVCRALVEQVEIGDLFRTESRPGKAGANRAVYRALGAKAAELHASLPRTGPLPPPVIIDADSEVPYEHIIGVVNACKEAKLDRVEFVANPRHDKYYGNHERGQFQREPRK
ncbi:MAG TPA: biopolymer transporter ExbD [Planctomycetota bacterium]|nr:biopolymer transporter ExbD [Planctomycetota bacterium]